ncbi:sugar ABC transporter permease [Salinarchaeum sp. Harcht-Bsk1]|uniref:carbohydrate ABC transporter permease n=1 Tax=Salinarchaeum sp. Harcht-Bsk1 TaxID=1333523 RepID=UPI00034239D6|nr:carbohydrate ABC transporter permease [Salinarchaeum sp. Harcht-Bsk1]AGN02754.1 sugar ABC transporter permease [Salinarchaeum sp. Harcht-Bsk1]
MAGGVPTPPTDDTDQSEGEVTESRRPSERLAEGLPLAPGRIVLYLALLAGLVFYLIPLHSGLMTAISQGISGVPYAPPGLDEFTLDNWGTAYESVRPGLINSFLFVLPATVLSATFGSLAAFGLTKLSWRGQIGILMLFVAGVFIPYQSVLVPLRLFWGQMALAGSLELLGDSLIPPLSSGAYWLANHSDLIELTITHTAYGIPICTVLFRGYYLTIDTDMIEAAQVDGASMFTVYRRIILPLSKPMFAVTMIYQFTNIWNDLLFALILVTDSEQQVATQQLQQLFGSMTTNFPVVIAAAFVVATPTVIIYVLFGKQFAEGITGSSG